ncbi:MAG: hypothetical protein AMJ79_00835 [Phycisphaerae bacterium SM23_30]|nr:MAG: hypothetical protein AMJ79_00835 [Phycisphaerae bacterium SM23_30]
MIGSKPKPEKLNAPAFFDGVNLLLYNDLQNFSLIAKVRCLPTVILFGRGNFRGKIPRRWKTPRFFKNT